MPAPSQHFAARTLVDASDFPTFDSSDFSGEAGAFYFDLVRLENRPDIPRGFPHRHNYYHLLWMSEAAGTHLLDFESFDARANAVFFVSPGQLNAWASTVQPKGFVINFSTEFFVQMFPRSDEIAQYPFFHIASDAPVLYLSQAQTRRIAASVAGDGKGNARARRSAAGHRAFVSSGAAHASVPPLSRAHE